VLEESALIPYAASPLPAGPWLVLAPHPDDETLGLGGSLARARQKGLEVHVAFISDGEGAGDPFLRRQEALSALKILGVQDFSFWNLPDRKIFRHFNAFALKFFSLKITKFKSIFVPSLFEFHPDHRAVAWMTLALLKALSWSGEIWFYEISRQGEVNRLLDISPFIENKKRAILCYKSQLSQNAYLEISLALNRARAYTLTHKNITYAEGFFVSQAEKAIFAFAEHLQRYFLTVWD